MTRMRGNELAALRMANRSKIIGVIEGVFDVLHVGHLVAIAALRRRCDFLVVMVKGGEFLRDSGVETVMRESNRLLVVKSLRDVDFAYCYTGALDKHLRELKPDVFGTAHPERYPKDFPTHLKNDYKCDFAQLTRVPRTKKRLIYET